MKRLAAFCTPMLFLTMAQTPAHAQSIRSGFDLHSLPVEDDVSSGCESFGFTINFLGAEYSCGFVNQNGNLTFNDFLSDYVPFEMTTTAPPILAPFFADVDTRGSGAVTFGHGIVDGRNAFGVSWIDVGYYFVGADLLNTFQLVMIDRSDTGIGNFDFEFNYGPIQWEAGDLSGGVFGLCDPLDAFAGLCEPARVGWSNGASASYEIEGSGDAGAFVESGADALSDQRVTFEIRNTVSEPAVVPEPFTVLLLATGLIGIAGAAMLKRHM